MGKIRPTSRNNSLTDSITGASQSLMLLTAPTGHSDISAQELELAHQTHLFDSRLNPMQRVQLSRIEEALQLYNFAAKKKRIKELP